MRLKLYKHNENYCLIVSSGVMRIISKAEALDVIFNFDNHLNETSGETPFSSYFDSYPGELIAALSKEGCLTIHNAQLYREILTPSSDEFPYLCLSAYADKHNRTASNVRKHCRASRIPGAILVGPTWLIPKNAPYPDDNRAKPNSNKLPEPKN